MLNILFTTISTLYLIISINTIRYKLSRYTAGYKPVVFF